MKWQGYDEITFEPPESFHDIETIKNYWQQMDDKEVVLRDCPYDDIKAALMQNP